MVRYISSWILILVLTITLGCSQSPESITGSYVSPLIYQHLECGQIRQEMHRVSRRVQEVSGVQSSKATGDAVAMTVGLVIFWPALFFLAAGDDRAEELARLKGESGALEQAAIQKNCAQLVSEIEEERKRIEKKKAETKEDE